jgi:hypothetical protein
VKVDISRSEQLVFEPVMNDVIIGYTDLEEHQLFVIHWKKYWWKKCGR